jgi:MFS family permease
VVDQLPSNALEKSSASKSRGQSAFGSLASRSFRIYWLGLLLMFLGSQILQPAQAWLTFELTHSPLKLTLVLAVQSVPMLLLCLYSGVVIDRIQKRDVIIISQGLTAAVALAIALLVAAGHIQYWHLLISSFLGGINAAFMITARNSIIAELVPRERLFNAMALYSVGANAAGIAGPALSGTLMGLRSIQFAYFAGIILSVVGIIVIIFLPATSTLNRTSGGSTLRNLIEGLRYLKVQKLLVMLLVMELALTLFGMCYQGLIPVFADLLGEKSEGYGFMLSATGVGSLLGSLGVVSLGNFKKKGRLLLATGIAFGAALVFFANTGSLGSLLRLGNTSIFLASALLIVIGVFVTGYTTTSSTLIQMNVTDEFRGRVTSVYGMVVGFYPVATLGVGAIAEALGAPLALTIAGSCLAVFMLAIAIISLRVRRLE